MKGALLSICILALGIKCNAQEVCTQFLFELSILGAPLNNTTINTFDIQNLSYDLYVYNCGVRDLGFLVTESLTENFQMSYGFKSFSGINIYVRLYKKGFDSIWYPASSFQCGQRKFSETDKEEEYNIKQGSEIHLYGMFCDFKDLKKGEYKVYFDFVSRDYQAKTDKYSNYLNSKGEADIIGKYRFHYGDGYFIKTSNHVIQFKVVD